MQKGFDYIAVGVSFYCHDGNGKFLMSKRSQNCRDEKGRWDFGGGGIDFEDGIEDTLRKELKEEYGAENITFEFMGYRDAFREQDGKKTHWIQFDFKVLVDPKEIKNCEPHKFDELGWFTLDNLPTPLHSLAQMEADTYREKLLKA